MSENLALQRLRVLSNYMRKVEYSECSARPTLHLSKSNVLLDEKVQITVKGLAKNQKVTLHTLLDNSSNLYAAYGHYVANEAGEVDTFQHSSLGGTFEGVESMGLFWSMKYQNPKSPRRLIKKDVTTPFDIRIAVHDGFLDFEDLPWSENFPCLTQCVLHRHFMAPGVRRIPVRENGIYGTLFLPPGKGPFPAVIDIFGMVEGISETRAPLLTSHGIASFSLGYVAFEDLPKTPDELDYHYFLKTFDWLASHPAIDENAMGGLASCAGGGYLGVIAMKRPSLKCLVCINMSYNPIGPTQVLEGERLESNAIDMERIEVTTSGVALRNTFDINKHHSFIPIWRHGAKVLLIHGLEDQCIHPLAGHHFWNAIPEDFRGNFTHLEYPGAGHLIRFLYTPLCQASYNRIRRSHLLWGGEPKPHAQAEEDCWPKILDFFNAHLKK